MNLSLQGLLNGPINRLRFIRRFSTCLRSKDETVAEHCFYVAFYSMILGHYCTQNNEPLDWRVLLCRALSHDLEEAVTGDMPRNFKYSNEAMLQHIQSAGRNAATEVITSLSVDQGFLERFFSFWETSKHDDMEGNIVHFADYLSVMSYVLQELKTGNQYFVEHAESMEHYASVFRQERFNFLRPLVDEAWDILQKELYGKKKD